MRAACLLLPFASSVLFKPHSAGACLPLARSSQPEVIPLRSPTINHSAAPAHHKTRTLTLPTPPPTPPRPTCSSAMDAHLRPRSFDEFVAMTQDNIFLAGQLAEYQKAFK